MEKDNKDNKSKVVIIFVHRGNSEYLQYSLKNARKTNPNARIVLLGDESNNKYNFIEHHNISDYSDCNESFIKVYEHMSPNPYDYELFCFLRWFAIKNFMKKHNIEKIFHLDSDVMLYCNVEELSEKFKDYEMTYTNVSGHTSFFNSYSAIDNFCDFMTETYKTNKNKLKEILGTMKRRGAPHGIADMTLFVEYAINNPEKTFDMSRPFENMVFDDFISYPIFDDYYGNENKQQIVYLEKNGMKKIIFENHIPYAFLESGEKIRFCSLHLQGDAKKHMEPIFRKGKFKKENTKGGKLMSKIFKKEKRDNRRIVTILGVKFSYKKNSGEVIVENTPSDKLVEAGAIVTDDYYEIEGLKFLNNPCVDREVIYEILVEKNYFFKTQGMTKDSYVVIDMGMNTAIAAVALASQNYVSKVYAFEPLKPTFDIAVKNIEINNLTDKIEAFPYGLGKKDEKTHIKYSPEFSIAMSTYYDRDLQNFTLEEIEIKESSFVVRNILDKEKGKKVFLKVDTEGAEFDIFEDLDKSDLLKNIDVVFIEWHFKPKDELIDILVKNGFFCFSYQKDIHHNIGYIYAVKNIK